MKITAFTKFQETILNKICVRVWCPCREIIFLVVSGNTDKVFFEFINNK